MFRLLFWILPFYHLLSRFIQIHFHRSFSNTYVSISKFWSRPECSLSSFVYCQVFYLFSFRFSCAICHKKFKYKVMLSTTNKTKLTRKKAPTPTPPQPHPPPLPSKKRPNETRDAYIKWTMFLLVCDFVTLVSPWCNLRAGQGFNDQEIINQLFPDMNNEPDFDMSQVELCFAKKCPPRLTGR